MARRKRFLKEFLALEGMREEIEAGLVRLMHPQPTVGVWGYLSGVEVVPTRATGKLGAASYGRALMRITALPVSAAVRRETIAHEVAHLVAAYLHPGRIKPHGPEWQRVARALGAAPKASVVDPKFEEAALKVRESRLKIVGRCEKCGFEVLKMRRTNKYLKRRYTHVRCGGRIDPVY